MRSPLKSVPPRRNAGSHNGDGWGPRGRGPSRGGPGPRRIGPLIAIAALLTIPLFGPGLSRVYVDLSWFDTLGFKDVFATKLVTQVALGLGVGILTAAFLLINLRVAKALSQHGRGLLLRDPSGQVTYDVGQLVTKLPIPVSLGFGALFGLAAAGHWMTYLTYVHAQGFGQKDPILGHDAGFYLFQLPALEALSTLLVWWLGLGMAASAAMYVGRGLIQVSPGALSAERPARAHLSVLGAVLFVVLAFDAWLKIPNLMFSDLGPVNGASYADVHARMPALYILVGTCLLGAALVVVSATRQRLFFAFAALALYGAVEIVAVRVYPSMVHRFSVVPNEAQKEAPYIAHNIEATRRAFGLAQVTERELSGQVELTREDLNRNQATLENIRLWDHEPLLATFAQIQEIRTYYEFVSVDNDRYEIDGKLRQVMLSPRELSAASLPNRTWINERFTFTHGYGLTLGTVNSTTTEGLPELLLKDIPPQSATASIKVTRPEIYFGELSNDHIFVNTDAEEFDYPAAEDVYATYQGRAGLALNSSLRRIATSLHVGSLKVLLSEDLKPKSRVLLYRNVAQRVNKLAPFLFLDSDPYMVVRDDGSLAWILDAYTMSDRYPYAQKHGVSVGDGGRRFGVNYMRNAVKVVVDAYHGDVTFYAVDSKDAILRTFASAFPTLFTSLDEMPEDIRRHLRYPEDIFRAQTEVFSVYHMDEPELLYNREDQWEIPRLPTDGTEQVMSPYYTVMKLPEEREAEFIQMLPFTPKSKANLAAWMVSRMDGDQLGKLVVYRFPKDRLVYGPQQVMSRINQDPEISRQISLWDQRGSEAKLGTLLVIPVEESLIYVCPLYLRSNSGGGRGGNKHLPELKRVIVAYENRIAMEETLDGAMAALFPSELPAAVEAGQATSADSDIDQAPPPLAATAMGSTGVQDAADRPAGGAAKRAQQAYKDAVKAQRAGDWAAYGTHLRALEAALDELDAP